jgi:cyclohexyl-isocyanide hydratase
MITRREAFKVIGLATGSVLIGSLSCPQVIYAKEETSMKMKEETKMKTIGILVFPNAEEMDFIGPFEVLSYINKIKPESTKVLLIAENSGPVTAFNGLTVIPHATLKDCPPLDVLVVPGGGRKGEGRWTAMKNPVIIDFIKKQANTAQYVTSVCSGAFLLAEAGLLTGKKATTHHYYFSELEAYDVKVITKKVVHDGQIITSAGVTSGLEYGFYMLKLMFGAENAQEVARRIEYNIDVNTL